MTRLALDPDLDEKILEIRAAGSITKGVGNALMLPNLPHQIPPGHQIAGVTADVASDTPTCHDTIAARWFGGACIPAMTAAPTASCPQLPSQLSSSSGYDQCILRAERCRDLTSDAPGKSVQFWDRNSTEVCLCD